MFFIDEIYENKTKLFCLSQVGINEIYPKGKAYPGFNRTISRLNEIGNFINHNI